MFNTTTLESLFSEDLDQENLISEEDKVFGTDLELSVDLEMDTTVPSVELELLELERQGIELFRSADMHSRLEAQIEAAKENGGLRGEAVSYVTDIYNDASAVLGKFAADIPDAEAFGEVGGAVDGAGDVQLAIKENAEKLKAGAMKLINKIIAKLKELFKRYLTKAGRVRGKIDKLMEAGKKVKGVPASGNVKVSGGVYTSEKHAVLAKGIKDLSKDGFKQTIKAAEAYISGVDKDDKTAVQLAVESFATAVDADLGLSEASDDRIKKAGMSKDEYASIKTTDDLGGRALVFAFPKKDSSRAPVVKLVAVLKDTELTFKHQDHNAILVSAVMLSDAGKASSTASEKAMEQVEKAAKAVKETGDYGQQLKGIVSFIGEVGKQTTTWSILAAEATANYAGACIKNLGGKADDKKDDDKKDDDKKDEE